MLCSALLASPLVVRLPTSRPPSGGKPPPNTACSHARLADSLVHITKEAFAGQHTLPEVYEPIAEITLHIFCSVYVPEAGEWRAYDATEKEGSWHLLEHLPLTDETRYQSRWLRGPVAPVQASIDHLLTTPFKSRIAPSDIEAQNALWRRHRI